MPAGQSPSAEWRSTEPGGHNHKTIGCLMYDDSSREMMRSTLEKRAGTLKPVEPKVKTKLFLKKKREAELANNAEREHQKHVEAVQAFMQALSLHDSGSEYIDRSKLKDALEGFPPWPICWRSLWRRLSLGWRKFYSSSGHTLTILITKEQPH